MDGEPVATHWADAEAVSPGASEPPEAVSPGALEPLAEADSPGASERRAEADSRGASEAAEPDPGMELLRHRLELQNRREAEEKRKQQEQVRRQHWCRCVVLVCPLHYS